MNTPVENTPAENVPAGSVAAQDAPVVARSWTPSRGATRYYINDFAALIGLDVELYKSGNVCFASLDGVEIANSAGERIIGIKVWVDDAGTVHVDRAERLPVRVITAEQIIERVKAAIAERGLIRI